MALASSDPTVVAAALAGPGSFALVLPAGDPVTLTPEDVSVMLTAPEGWAAVADCGTQILLDARITPELAAEGMAREAERHVHELRKTAQLEMEDRIEPHLSPGSDSLREALDVHCDYICAETPIYSHVASGTLSRNISLSDVPPKYIYTGVARLLLDRPLGSPSDSCGGGKAGSKRVPREEQNTLPNRRTVLFHDLGNNAVR